MAGMSEAERLAERSDAAVRFKRTLRRLGLISRFASSCGVVLRADEFDLNKLHRASEAKK